MKGKDHYSVKTLSRMLHQNDVLAAQSMSSWDELSEKLIDSLQRGYEADEVLAFLAYELSSTYQLWIPDEDIQDLVDEIVKWYHR